MTDSLTEALMQENLREAISFLRKEQVDILSRRDPRTMTYALGQKLKLVLDAAETTLPKTRMAETWRVAFSRLLDGKWRPLIHGADSREEAEREVERLRGHCCRCIEITGPHQQEVPRDPP